MLVQNFYTFNMYPNLFSRTRTHAPGMCRLPKQYPAVPAMTWPPFPALWTSLIRPPVPVVAPLNGATPGGGAEIHVGTRWHVTHTLKATGKTKRRLVFFVAAATCGEVVRLRGEDDVSQRAPGLVGAGLGRICGVDALQLDSSDAARKHTFRTVRSCEAKRRHAH